MRLRIFSVTLILIFISGIFYGFSIKPNNKFQKIEKITSVKKLVKRIKSKNCVYNRGIGISGEYTTVYAYYARLKQIATAEQLFELTKHNNAAVRTYSYMALTEKDSILALKAYKYLKTDSTKVYNLSGCSGGMAPVYFMIRYPY